MPKTYSPEFVHEERGQLVMELGMTQELTPAEATAISTADVEALLAYADEWDSFCRECIITVAARKILALRPMNRTPAP